MVTWVTNKKDEGKKNFELNYLVLRLKLMDFEKVTASKFLT